MIAETFKGKGVTVAAVAGEQTLLLYASAKQTGEVRDLLAKLGDEPSLTKAAILRLKNMKCTDAARVLQEVFNGPKPMGRSSRVTIVAIPDDNSLLVFATPIDLLTARELLAEHIDAPAPEKKTEQSAKQDEKHFSMRFQNVAWDDVLDWYGKTSGLTPILTVKPKGQFTFLPPKADQKYTLAEITDILNEALASQKFILIRRQVTFIIHPADEKIDRTEVPLVELGDLATRGKTELVQVLIPLKLLTAEETAPEIRRLLSPFGTVSDLKNNTLIVLDTAQNVSRIYKMIQDIEDAGSGDHLIHVCKYKKVQEVADHLRRQFMNKPADGNLIGMRLFEDEKANTMVIIASTKDIAFSKRIIEAFDKPKNPGDKPIKLPEPALRKYPVPAGTANAIAKALMADYPSLRIIAVPAADEVWIMATPEEHTDIKKKLGGPKSSN